MAIERILVSVMTYPALSDKHFETVCTAGFREDGSWIRIFPVPYRVLLGRNESKRYHKWQWIEVDLEQNLARDIRRESFHIKNIDSLKLLARIDTPKRIDWDLRICWVLKNKKVYRDMSDLLEDTKRDNTSLAVLKPSRIVDVICEKADMSKFEEKLKRQQDKYKSELLQMKLFEDEYEMSETFRFAEKVPYKFSYAFTTEDGKLRTLMIEDWELGMLYRKMFQRYHNEEVACQKVREKYLKMAGEDLYLFLGTSYEWHMKKSKDPYMIIGVFAPPKKDAIQTQLDF
jgi:hypothetical protein